MPGIFPDYPAPIVRNADDGGRELAMQDIAAEYRPYTAWLTFSVFERASNPCGCQARLSQMIPLQTSWGPKRLKQ
jgi:hypothetical protein